MKKHRQQAILGIIENQIIDTQEGLQEALIREGYNVTQATVSRDIKELRIVKSLDAGGVYRYMQGGSAKKDENNARFADIFSSSVISIESAMNDVIIKCHIGAASGAAAAIDNMFSQDMLGTLAGDDTILAITRDEKAAKELVQKLKSLL